MAIFKRAGDKHALAIAMTGVKLGDRLLHVGCTDAPLVVAIGSKVGLSGRACALVSTDQDETRARSAAERGGILLEIEKSPLNNFPYPDHSFDLIVVDNQLGLIANARPEERVAVLQEARRTLAPRGRVVVIERAPRAGLGALLRGGGPPDPHYQSSGGAIAALKAEGFKAVRQLAERDGLSFFEGIG
jgi:ubiquinone/menaquinone biosynthesis C-methylase UbiE